MACAPPGPVISREEATAIKTFLDGPVGKQLVPEKVASGLNKIADNALHPPESAWAPIVSGLLGVLGAVASVGLYFLRKQFLGFIQEPSRSELTPEQTKKILAKLQIES